jgi:sugar lactone lactonase YvrE
MRISKLLACSLIVSAVGPPLAGLGASARQPKERASLDTRDEVLCMAIAPDGKTLACGGWEKITLLDAEAGKEIRTLKRPDLAVCCVAFSPDGKVLASGSLDNTIKLWEARTGKALRALKGHAERLAGLAFSPDGKTLVSGSRDQAIKFWDVGSAKVVRTLNRAGGSRFVVLSPDGRTLASNGLTLPGKRENARLVTLRDVASGKERLTLTGHRHSVFCAAFSPDGKVLASAGDGNTVRLHDVTTGKEIHALEGHTDAVGSLAFTRDGRTLASGSNDGTVRLWDVGAGKERATLRPRLTPRAGRVHAVAWTREGKTLALGMMDGTVRLWNVAPVIPRGKALGGPKVLHECIAAIRHPGERLVRITGRVKVHDANTLVFADGTRVQVDGAMDPPAPEQKMLISKEFDPCGKQAIEFLREQIGDRPVSFYAFGNGPEFVPCTGENDNARDSGKLRGRCFVGETRLAPRGPSARPPRSWWT